MEEKATLPEDDLILPPLQVPDFKSTIPDHAIENLPKPERVNLHSMNVFGQYLDFLAKTAINQDRLLRQIYTRQTATHKVIRILNSKWAPIFYIGAILLPACLVKLVNKLLGTP